MFGGASLSAGDRSSGMQQFGGGLKVDVRTWGGQKGRAAFEWCSQMEAAITVLQRSSDVHAHQAFALAHGCIAVGSEGEKGHKAILKALAADSKAVLQGGCPSEGLPDVPELDAKLKGVMVGGSERERELAQMLQGMMERLNQLEGGSSRVSSPTLPHGNPFADFGGFESGRQQEQIRVVVPYIDEDGIYVSPDRKLIQKYFSLIRKYFGECTKDEVEEFFKLRQGVGEGVRQEESANDFGQRINMHHQRINTKCTSVRPMLPGQEVLVFLKGLKPEYAAGVAVLRDEVRRTPVLQQSLEWAMVIVSNAMDNVANLEDLEQRLGGMRLLGEGSGGGSGKGKKEEGDLGSLNPRQLKQHLQGHPVLEGKLRAALGAPKQAKSWDQQECMLHPGKGHTNAECRKLPEVLANVVGGGATAPATASAAEVGYPYPVPSAPPMPPAVAAAAAGVAGPGGYGRGAPGAGRGQPWAGGRAAPLAAGRGGLAGAGRGFGQVPAPGAGRRVGVAPRPCECWRGGRHMSGICYISNPTLASSAYMGPLDPGEHAIWVRYRIQDGMGPPPAPPPVAAAIALAPPAAEPLLFNAFGLQLVPESDAAAEEAWAGQGIRMVAATTRARAQGAAGEVVSGGVQGLVGRAMLRPGRDKDLMETLMERRKSLGSTAEVAAVAAGDGAAVSAAASRLHSFTVPTTPAQQQQALVGSDEPVSMLLQVDLYLPADRDVLEELQMRYGVERKEWAAREQKAGVTAAVGVEAQQCSEEDLSLLDLQRWKQLKAETVAAKEKQVSAAVALPNADLKAAQAAVAEAFDAAELAATAAREAAALVAAAAPCASADLAAAVGVTGLAAAVQMGSPGDWEMWRECAGTLAFFRNDSAAEGVSVRLPEGRVDLPGRAMLDCGSEVDIVTHEHVIAAGLPHYPMEQPMTMRNADGALHVAQYTTGPLQVVLAEGTDDRTEETVSFTILPPGSGADKIYDYIFSTRWSHRVAGRGLDQVLRQFRWSPGYRVCRDLREASVPMRCYLPPGVRVCTSLQLVTAGVQQQCVPAAAAVALDVSGVDGV